MFFDALTGLLKTGLDKVIPDANVREQVVAELAQQAQALVEAEVRDRASARAREMEVKDTTPSFLAVTFTIGLFAGAFWFNLHPPSEASKVVVEMLMSALRDGWLMAVAYYYGAMNRPTLKL